MARFDTAKIVLRASFVVALLAATYSNIAFVWNYGHALACWNLGIDTVEYDQLSRQLLQTRSLSSIPPFQPLGFIVTLAGLYDLLGGSPLAVKVVFCLMTAVMAVGAWQLGVRFIGELEGAVAGSLVAWSPLLGAYSATLQYEVTVAFLVFSATFCLLMPILPDVRRTFLMYVCGAVLLLAALLSRETVLAALPVFILVPTQNQRLSRSQRLKAVLVVGLITCLGLGMCTVWRSYATGRLIPISDKGGLALRYGNNPDANGTFNTPQVGMREPSGWPFIMSHPLQTLKLDVRKAGYFFGILYDGWNVPRPAALFIFRGFGGILPYSWALFLARGALVAALALTGALLILRSPQLRARLWPVPLVVACMMLVHVFYLSSCRFSIPSLPLILLLCAVSIGYAFRFIWNSGWKTRGVALGGAILFLVVGVFREPRLVLGFAAADFLSAPARPVADPGAVNPMVLRYPAGPGSPLILFAPPEMLPRGFGRCEISASAFPKGQNAGLELALVAEDAGAVMTISRAKLVLKETGYRTFSIPFYCPKDLPVSLTIRSLRGGASLDSIVLRGALGEDGRENRMLLANAGVVFDAANNTESSRNTGYGWADLEDWKDPGVVQWAIGHRSFLYCERTTPAPQRLVFRASAFGALPNQSVTLLFNGQVLQTVPLSREWREYSVCIPSGTVGHLLNLIEFRHAAARSPFDLGMSLDARKLAAAYQAVRLLPVGSCSTGPYAPRPH